jgi:hypothetical protein
MSTITASRFVVGKKIQTPAGNSRVHYLQRLMVTRIAKTNAIYNARSFKTEEEARKVLEILNDRYFGKWVVQEVTKDLETLNENGLPYSRRFKVLKEVE